MMNSQYTPAVMSASGRTSFQGFATPAVIHCQAGHVFEFPCPSCPYVSLCPSPFPAFPGLPLYGLTAPPPQSCSSQAGGGQVPVLLYPKCCSPLLCPEKCPVELSLSLVAALQSPPRSLFLLHLHIFAPGSPELQPRRNAHLS